MAQTDSTGSVGVLATTTTSSRRDAQVEASQPIVADLGQVEGRVGRESASVEMTSTEDEISLVVGDARVSESIFGNDSTQVELLKNGLVIVPPRSSVRTVGEGFEPGSEVEIWLHSDPVKLDTLTVNEDGKFTSIAKLPIDLEAGQHSLRIVSYPAPSVGESSAAQRVASFEVAFGILSVDDSVVAMNDAGKVSLEVANRVFLRGFEAISVVGDGRASTTIAFLLLILCIVVFFGGTPLVRRRRVPDVLSGVLDEAPSLAALGAWRSVILGVAVLLSVASSLLVGADPVPGTTLIFTLLLILSIIDPRAGVVSALTTAVMVIAGGGVSSVADARALVVLGSMFVVPAVAASAVTYGFASPRLRRLAPSIGGATASILIAGLASVHRALIGVELSYETWLPVTVTLVGLAYAVRRDNDELTRQVTAKSRGLARMRPTFGIAPLGLALVAFVSLARQFVGLSSLLLILVLGIIVALRTAPPLRSSNKSAVG